MHAIIALRRGEEHWMLNDADAKVYGQALKNAIRHIPIKRAQKSIDFAMLIFAIGQFEAPRIMMSVHNDRARRSRPTNQPPSPGHVVYPFPSQGMPRQPPPPPSPPVTPPPGAPTARSPAGGDVGFSPRTNGAAVDMTYEPESAEPRVGP